MILVWKWPDLLCILRYRFQTLFVVTCKHEEHCGIIFEGMSKRVAYFDYSVCVAVYGSGSQLPIICCNHLQPPVACGLSVHLMIEVELNSRVLCQAENPKVVKLFDKADVEFFFSNCLFFRKI